MATFTQKNTLEEQLESAIKGAIETKLPGLELYSTRTEAALPRSFIGLVATRETPTGQRRQTAQGTWVFDSWGCSMVVAVRTDRSVDGALHEQAKAACIEGLQSLEQYADASVMPFFEVHQVDVESIEVEADDADEADADITRINATCFVFLRLGVQI